MTTTLASTLDIKTESRIESVLEKYSENEEILEKLNIRVASINLYSRGWSTDKIANTQAILDYISLKIGLYLENIKEQKQDNISELIELEIPEVPTQIGQEHSEANTSEKINFTDFNDGSYAILAWESRIVYKANISARLESLEVWEVTFAFKWTDIDGIERAIDNASLYIGDYFVDTNSNSDIRQISSTHFQVIFDNLDDFIITENEMDLRLIIHTNPIGFQKIGQTIPAFVVERVWFSDVQWLTSNRESSNFTLSEPWYQFGILPGTIGIDVTQDFNTSPRIKFDIVPWLWSNTRDDNNGIPPINITKIILDVNGLGTSSWTQFFLGGDRINAVPIQWIISGRHVEFDLTSLWGVSVSNREEFEIIVSNAPDTVTTLFVDLRSDGIKYNVPWVSWANNLSIDFESDIDLGSRNFR